MRFIQLFQERLSDEMCTRQSRKVIWDMLHTLFLTLQLSNYYCCFPLALANISPWSLVTFLQISLKNSELKTTHNTSWDCRVHFKFLRQPFSNSCVQMKNALMRGRKTNSNTNIEDNTCCSSPQGAYLFQAHLRGPFLWGWAYLI